MSALADHLRGLIDAEGPITVARFMAQALGHPQLGYYATRDPLGVAGDFVTAPEISQMFGELLGLWCVECWDRMGRPGDARLVELGPGRGTLMADALRAARQVPAFGAAVSIHLVETSPPLRARQEATLTGHRPTWHTDFGAVPPGPLLLLANEFFDALPIHQLERTREGWRERLVNTGAGGFGFVLAAGPTPALDHLPAALAQAPQGALCEVAPAAWELATAIGGRLAAAGGAALVVDYGYRRTRAGETLQAVRRHAPVSPLTAPGDCDITAHVDFAALARAAQAAGAASHGPVPQGAFLRRLGIERRATGLAADASPAQRTEIAAALARLLAPDAMGRLFQALALTPAGAPRPPGFEDDG